MERISKRFAAGPVVVLVGCTLAAAASFQPQTMPAAAAAAQPTLVPPLPGGEIPADPALLQAIAKWLPSVGTIPPPTSIGGRD